MPDTSTTTYPAFTSLSVNLQHGVAFVTIEYGDINVLDMTLVNDLIAITDLLKHDNHVKVIVFQSANTDFFLSHAYFPLLQQFRDQGAYNTIAKLIQAKILSSVVCRH